VLFPQLDSLFQHTGVFQDQAAHQVSLPQFLENAGVTFKALAGWTFNNFSPKAVKVVQVKPTTLQTNARKSVEHSIIGSTQPLGQSTYDNRCSVAAEPTGPGLRATRVTSGWWEEELPGWFIVDKAFPGTCWGKGDAYLLPCMADNVPARRQRCREAISPTLN